jgi:hypothetical protein
MLSGFTGDDYTRGALTNNPDIGCFQEPSISDPAYYELLGGKLFAWTPVQEFGTIETSSGRQQATRDSYDSDHA